MAKITALDGRKMLVIYTASYEHGVTFLARSLGSSMSGARSAAEGERKCDVTNLK